MDDLQLELPTGALIAGDAAALFADARPLLEGLPTGRFPATARDGGLEVRLTEADPVAWTESAELPAPSGYAALLDAAALARYTDLGDEPVDEFELLSERFENSDAAVFQGVLAVRGGTGRVSLRLGRDAAGTISRIALAFSPPRSR
ncbi:MAG TPA: hypothetical protein VFN97_15250 [Actinospica sp.]|nr:hypothetical protein [Actinospica sp.]